ncbi:MAG: PulJ/GspJ family protein [Mycobacterium sp.]
MRQHAVGALAGRKAFTVVRARIERTEDAGFSLVELMIAFATFAVLVTLVAISINTFLSVSNQVQSSYTNANQILPVTTSIQRLIRTEVEPGPPSGSGLPVPPFVVGAVSKTSATFYANVGVAGQPAKVVATLTGTTFKVTDQLADAGTCPLSVASAATCKFTLNPARPVATMFNVVNSSWPSVGSPTPVFTYTLLDTSGGGAGVQTTVTNTSVFNGCTSSADLAVSCPGDAVQGVEMDLVIKSPGSKSLAPAEDDTTVYRLSSNSFLYSPTVG